MIVAASEFVALAVPVVGVFGRRAITGLVIDR